MKTFLAIFTGSPDSPASKNWAKLDANAKKEREQAGMSAWGNWMHTHHHVLEYQGGPLGKTKLVDNTGVYDTKNQMAAFTIVKAESHEAAAKMFVNHPHFSIFPGDGVEIMEVMPIPGR